MPVGAVYNNKIKVIDSSTGKTVWRGGKKGVVLDNEGLPTTKVEGIGEKGKKRRPVHTGYKPHKN